MANGYINIVSWNINSCRTPVKDKKNPHLSYRPCVTHLETHFQNEEEALKLKSDWVGNVFNNSISSKSCGVVIPVKNKCIAYSSWKKKKGIIGKEYH